MIRLSIVAVTLFMTSALAEIGTITALEGKGTRTPRGGAAEPLAIGTKVELHDTLAMQGGKAKLTLNDESVIGLDGAARLDITEAEFQGQERKAFGIYLFTGAVWAKVKKAVTESKFEVTTERAVAGVRGTVFRLDADALIKAVNAGKGRRASVVRVVEGVVNVHPTEKFAKTMKGALGQKPKGPKKEIAAPFHEVTADQWEKIFVDLQANKQVAVGTDLFEQAEIEEAALNDAFSTWFNKGP